MCFINGTNMIEDKILTKKRFSEEVENRMAKGLEVSYIDACIKVCEDHQFPPEDAGRLISPSLYSKIEAEAARANLVKAPATNTTMLPI
jgi:hypothetical protein